MSERYQRRFAALKERGEKIFMPFTLLGWPDKQKCLQIIRSMVDNGATALELGIPFSDPVADGPVIARAAFEVLEQDFKVSDAFALLKEARAMSAEIPIGILVYYNIVLTYGVEKFFQQAREAGVDGVLIADLPVEASAEVLPHARANDVDLIFIISPVTPYDRIGKIATVAGGFIYFVSRLGVTGTDKSATGLGEIKDLIDHVKSHTNLPICAGFGVSNKENASALLDAGADGVIVGSRVIEVVRAQSDFAPGLKQLFGELHDACSNHQKIKA